MRHDPAHRRLTNSFQFATLVRVSSVDLDRAPEGDILTIPQAARRLGVDPKLLRRARDERRLAVYQIGDRWQRVLWSEVVAWVRSTHVRPTDAAAERVARVLARERAGP